MRIEEIETDHRVAQAQLAGTGISDLDILEFEHFGPAELVKADCFDHVSSELSACLSPDPVVIGWRQ